MFYLFTSLALLPYYHSHPITILSLLPFLPYYLSYLITFLYQAVSFILSAK